MPSRVRNGGLLGYTILVVDDRPETTDMLRMALRAAGAEVRCTVDGVSALETLRAKQIDAVVCDLRMPRMDGYEFVARVRAIEQERALPLPVVAVTGEDSWRYRDPYAAAANGFDYHFVKPVEPQSLVDKLRALLIARARKPAET